MKWIKLWEQFGTGDDVLNIVSGILNIVSDILVELNQSNYFKADCFWDDSAKKTLSVIIDLKDDYKYDDSYHSISSELYDDIIVRLFHYMKDWNYRIILANDEAIPPGGDPNDYMVIISDISALENCDLVGDDFIRIDFKKRLENEVNKEV